VGGDGFASINEDWASKSEEDPFWWTEEQGTVELAVLIMVSQKTRPGSKTATVMSYECNRNRKAKMFHSLV
jgi:hypothetical protein